MAELNYLDHHADIAQGFNQVGNSMARAALGMAALRERQRQQEFENMLKMAMFENEQRLEGVRERLYGKQAEAQVANAELDKERTLQLRGLAKLADEVEATTIDEQLKDLPDIHGRPYSPARGSMFADTLTNRLKIASAKKKAALEKAVILGVAPAASRLRPFNLGQYGTIDQMTGEEIAPSQAPERLHNLPPETLMVDDEGNTIATGLPRTRPPSTSPSAYDQAILHVIEAQGRGSVTPEEKAEMLSMTNLLSKPISAPAANLGTGTTSTTVEAVPADPAQRVVGKVYKLPRGSYRWTANGWVNP